MALILICDNEKDIVNSLSIILGNEGYEIAAACNGKEAVDIVKSGEKIDLVLMDIMMPVMNGIEAVVKIREVTNVPVIMLSAKGDPADRVLGLNVGADDYITKPFDTGEVIARVKAQIRRYNSLGGHQDGNDSQLVNGGIVIDDMTKTVFVNGDAVALTPREYDILHFLMENPGRVFSPKEIYRKVWNDEPIGAENTITVHIRHLREKIEINPADPDYILVSWGHGYKMEDKRNPN